MVIGKGLIAKAFMPKFENDDDVVIFASGVSNSKEIDRAEYTREFELISRTIEENPDKKFIYFSTCSVLDQCMRHTPYVRFKLLIERYIEFHCNRYLIFRLSNVVGPTDNPSTIVNYLFHKIAAGEKFRLWQGALRNILDIDHVVAICTELVDIYDANTFNVANALSLPIERLVSDMEDFIGKKAIYETMPIESNSVFKISKIVDGLLDSLDACPIHMNYFPNLLKKYYYGK